MSPRLSALLLWDLGQGAKKNKKSWEDVSPKHLHSEAEMGLLLGDSAHVSLLFLFSNCASTWLFSEPRVLTRTSRSSAEVFLEAFQRVRWTEGRVGRPAPARAFSCSQ